MGATCPGPAAVSIAESRGPILSERVTVVISDALGSPINVLVLVLASC
jgi:hypothetical protein